jgi:hypothetical protein
MKRKNFLNKSLMAKQIENACFRVDLQDVDWPDGADNTAGVAQYIYGAPVSYFDTIPDVIQPDPTGSGSLSDLVTIKDNYVLKSGKDLIKLYVTLETGKLDSETQGEFDGMSFLNKLEFLIPGSTPTALGFARLAKNGSWIWFVPLIDGQKRVVGHRNYPAKLVSAPHTTGQKSADRKAGTYTFQSAWSGPAPIFTGRIKVSGVGSGADADQDGYQEILYAD